MTKALEQAFQEASNLPEKEQNALAEAIRNEVMGDQDWERTFAGSPDGPEKLADEAIAEHRVFAKNRYHPSLQFKQVHPGRPIFPARVALGHRALAVRDGDDLVWFWVGSHADSDQLLSHMRRGCFEAVSRPNEVTNCATRRTFFSG